MAVAGEEREEWYEVQRGMCWAQEEEESVEEDRETDRARVCFSILWTGGLSAGLRSGWWSGKMRQREGQERCCREVSFPFPFLFPYRARVKALKLNRRPGWFDV